MTFECIIVDAELASHIDVGDEIELTIVGLRLGAIVYRKRLSSGTAKIWLNTPYEITTNSPDNHVGDNAEN